MGLDGRCAVAVGVVLAVALLGLPTAAALDLAVGGQFVTAGTVTANNVARWSGTQWSALGAGIGSIRVESFAEFKGDLVAGGVLISGDPAYRVAQWNGTAWRPLAASFNQAVYSVIAYDGMLVAGGVFSTPQPYLAAWDGTTWSAVGPAITGGTVSSLGIYSGSLVVGGSFTFAGGITVNRIARWDGTSWAAFGSGASGPVLALVEYNGNLVAGGEFSTAGGITVNNIALWNGVSWSALGSGTNNYVYALTVYNGNLIAGGLFTLAGGISASRVALWNGLLWSALGSAVSDVVNALAVYGAVLVAGGAFTTAGGATANRVAQWNGAAWSALGTGTSGSVQALYTLAGDLPTTPPTTAPTTPPTTPPTTAPTTPPGDCSLEAFDWRAQYYTNDTILVEDDLTFDGLSGTFEQNTTAFPFQTCLSNGVDWRGDYEQVNATSLLLSYARCTQSGVGCLSCGPTFEELVGVSFADDCETLTLKHPAGDVRTYFPAKVR